MQYKIQYKDFLKTFNKKQAKDIVDYYKVMELHNKGYSRSEIRKRLEISIDKLNQWRNMLIKPCSVKTLEEAKIRGYFNQIQKWKMELLSYIIGYNLGDGNISRNLCNTWFYGVDSDLKKICPILTKFNVKPVIYTYKINNGKMAVHDRIFSRFLVCLGGIIGDKTKSEIEVPKWILNSGEASKFKLRFLQGFFDSELSNPKLNKENLLAYKSLKLYISKHKDCIENGRFFLEQIKSILKEFNVISSEARFDRAYIRKRDKGNMQQLYLLIYSNYINLFNFLKNIGFLYNSKRRNTGIKTLRQIKHLAKKELIKIKGYEKALQLRKRGWSAYKIAKRLNIELHCIKYWLYHRGKPSLYNFVKINKI